MKIRVPWVAPHRQDDPVAAFVQFEQYVRWLDSNRWYSPPELVSHGTHHHHHQQQQRKAYANGTSTTQQQQQQQLQLQRLWVHQVCNDFRSGVICRTALGEQVHQQQEQQLLLPRSRHGKRNVEHRGATPSRLSKYFDERHVSPATAIANYIHVIDILSASSGGAAHYQLPSAHQCASGEYEHVSQLLYGLFDVLVVRDRVSLYSELSSWYLRIARLYGLDGMVAKYEDQVELPLHVFHDGTLWICLFHNISRFSAMEELSLATVFRTPSRHEEVVANISFVFSLCREFNIPNYFPSVSTFVYHCNAHFLFMQAFAIFQALCGATLKEIDVNSLDFASARELSEEPVDESPQHSTTDGTLLAPSEATLHQQQQQPPRALRATVSSAVHATRRVQPRSGAIKPTTEKASTQAHHHHHRSPPRSPLPPPPSAPPAAAAAVVAVAAPLGSAVHRDGIQAPLTEYQRIIAANSRSLVARTRPAPTPPSDIPQFHQPQSHQHAQQAETTTNDNQLTIQRSETKRSTRRSASKSNPVPMTYTAKLISSCSGSMRLHECELSCDSQNSKLAITITVLQHRRQHYSIDLRRVHEVQASSLARADSVSSMVLRCRAPCPEAPPPYGSNVTGEVAVTFYLTNGDDAVSFHADVMMARQLS